MSTCDSVREIPKTNCRAPEKSMSATTTNLTFSHGIGLVAQPEQEKKVHADFEYAEHRWLGDSITLTLANGSRVLAGSHPFALGNGLTLTYGEINGLAGDFYGTENPISDGKTLDDQMKRFLAAYETLAGASSRQPGEAREILAVLKAEVDAVNDALKKGVDPSVIYSKLPDVTFQLDRITGGRYLSLAKINWDHFGIDARTAYNAGHASALVSAKNSDLDKAYRLNAFADHFLGDSFSAGHLRTPRRMLHSAGNPTADLCAKYMHDEDNAIGLSVRNPKGETWTMFGDKRALDRADQSNKVRCQAALQASADEIYTTWKTKQLPPAYKAWDHAATLASAGGPQVLAPLFQLGDRKRANIRNRRTLTYTTDWWYATTAAEIATSGWWTYPITIDGPKVNLAKSAAADTAPPSWSHGVHLQGEKGGSREAVRGDNGWTFNNFRLFRAKEVLMLFTACLLFGSLLLLIILIKPATLFK